MQEKPQDGIHALVPRERMTEPARKLRDIYAITPGYYLAALDAETGQPLPHFGLNGIVDLHLGLGDYAVHPDSGTLAYGDITASSPPIIVNGVIVGSFLPFSQTSAASGSENRARSNFLTRPPKRTWRDDCSATSALKRSSFEPFTTTNSCSPGARFTVRPV